MSQPIKFRVWDNLNKIFVYPRDNPYIVAEAYEPSVLTLNGQWFVNKGKNQQQFAHHVSWPGPRIGYTVQQFTGLLDKNRKEIYDGDVIALYPIKFERTKMGEGIYHLDTSKPLPSPDIIYARGIVGYDVDFCQYKVIYTWVCDAWKESGVASTALVKNHYEYEVVGNVFINPEMLMK